MIDFDKQNALLNKAVKPVWVQDAHKAKFEDVDLEIVRSQIAYQKWLLSSDSGVYVEELQRRVEIMQREIEYINGQADPEIALGRLKALESRHTFIKNELEQNKISASVARAQNREVSGEPKTRKTLTPEEKAAKANENLLSAFLAEAAKRGVKIPGV